MLKRIFLLFIMISCIFGLLIGCGENPGNIEQSGETQSSDNNQELGEEKLRIAAIFTGPVNDAGFNAPIYEGLIRAESKYACETTYVENIPQSDMEETIRGFAMQNYDIIIAHGFQFVDYIKKVAPEYPNIKFVMSSGDEYSFQEPNLTSILYDDLVEGFLGGVIAGLMTENNFVAGLGGLEITPIIKAIDGFEKD
jgi:basic membrane protein A